MAQFGLAQVKDPSSREPGSGKSTGTVKIVPGVKVVPMCRLTVEVARFLRLHFSAAELADAQHKLTDAQCLAMVSSWGLAAVKAHCAVLLYSSSSSGSDSSRSSSSRGSSRRRTKKGRGGRAKKNAVAGPVEKKIAAAAAVGAAAAHTPGANKGLVNFDNAILLGWLAESASNIETLRQAVQCSV
jgi:hypothetical protein